MTTFPVPPGFAQVTKDEFFAKLYADQRDIMPTTASETYSDWEVVRTRVVWGRSFPGWRNPDGEKAYFLAEETTR